ncbi:MAG: hypothetical protein M1559_02105 [Candidatus Marsarchaeota archaeon]|nr:hypothetical protein [Candidatus Marsarchaeota archaeon]
MAERISNESISRQEGYLYYVGKDGYVWQVPQRSNKSGTKKRIGNEFVQREKGFIYFVDSNGYIARAKQGRNKK